MNDIQKYIFGNSTYMLRKLIKRTFLHGIMERAERIFNKQMSDFLLSIENNYKDLKQYGIGKDFHRKLNVRKAPISLTYNYFELCSTFICDYMIEEEYMNSLVYVHRFWKHL